MQARCSPPWLLPLLLLRRSRGWARPCLPTTGGGRCHSGAAGPFAGASPSQIRGCSGRTTATAGAPGGKPGRTFGTRTPGPGETQQSPWPPRPLRAGVHSVNPMPCTPPALHPITGQHSGGSSFLLPGNPGPASRRGQPALAPCPPRPRARRGNSPGVLGGAVPQIPPGPPGPRVKGSGTHRQDIKVTPTAGGSPRDRDVPAGSTGTLASWFCCLWSPGVPFGPGGGGLSRSVLDGGPRSHPGLGPPGPVQGGIDRARPVGQPPAESGGGGPAGPGRPPGGVALPGRGVVLPGGVWSYRGGRGGAAGAQPGRAERRQQPRLRDRDRDRDRWRR